MLQNEFEGLTGLKVTEEQFEVINAMYMLNENETKGEFCNRYMQMSRTEVVNEMVKLNDRSKATYAEYATKKAELEKRIKELELELERANGTMDYMGKRWFYTTTDAENKLAAIAKILKGGAE